MTDFQPGDKVFVGFTTSIESSSFGIHVRIPGYAGGTVRVPVESVSLIEPSYPVGTVLTDSDRPGYVLVKTQEPGWRHVGPDKDVPAVQVSAGYPERSVYRWTEAYRP